MKHIPVTLRTSLDAEVRTLATCLKIKANGQEFGYTSHQEDMFFEDVSYKALPGFTCGTLNSKLLSGDQSLTLDFIKTQEVEKFFSWLQDLPQHPELTFFYIDYAHPQIGALQMRVGRLGHVVCSSQKAMIHMFSITDRLNQEIGELYSQSCRAGLGDRKCGVNIDPLVIDGEVIENDEQLKVKLDGDLGNKAYPSLIWKTGLNKGLTEEIKKIEKESGILTFSLPPFARIAVGDKFKLVPGCDKTLRCCHEIYNNILNFRGEPFIPEA